MTEISENDGKKKKITEKTPKDYQLLTRYNVVKIGTWEQLIIPVKKKQMIPLFTMLS